MEEADIKKDGRISYEEFLHVLSSEHRRAVTKIYDESEPLSVVSETDEEARAEEVLQQHGLLDSLKTSIHNFGTIKIPNEKS